MNRYLILEHHRLEADIAALETRLAGSRSGPGLRSRSVRSFLAALRHHKRNMLKDLDQRIEQQGLTLN